MFWIEQFFHLTRLDFQVLLAVVAGLAAIVPLRKLNRKRKYIPKKLVTLASVWYAIPFLVLFYAFFIEPNLLLIKEYDVDSPQVQLETPLKLIVIGDMQARARFAPSYVKYVVERVNDLDGDYVIWTGDLIEDTTADLPLFAPFGALTAKHGKVAVLGNHDFRDNMTDPVNQQMAKEVELYLQQLGFITLRNQSVMTKSGDQQVVFAGTEDLWSGKVDFKTVNRQVATVSGSLNLLVTHQPMTVIQNPQPELYALTLSGHCHGGQINFWLFNPIFGLPRLPPGCSANPDHVSGLFTEFEHQIFVTPGVGSLKIRARLLSPPEISVLNLY